MSTIGREQQGVQSAEVGLAVLAALAGLGAPASLSAIAAAADLAPAKAHRYLVSLLRAGMAVQDPASGRYDLGPAALELGLAALGRLDPQRLATDSLAALRDRLDETVCLLVWGNRGPTVVHWQPSSQAVTVNIRVGAVLPLLRSASGRVFLAWLPPAVTGPLIAAEAAAAGWSDAETGRRIAALVETVRRDRLGRTDGDVLPGVSAVSAPVFDHRGDLVFALTALGPSSGFDAGKAAAPARETRAVANALSQRLGHRPEPVGTGR